MTTRKILIDRIREIRDEIRAIRTQHSEPLPAAQQQQVEALYRETDEISDQLGRVKS